MQSWCFVWCWCFLCVVLPYLLHCLIWSSRRTFSRSPLLQFHSVEPTAYGEICVVVCLVSGQVWTALVGSSLELGHWMPSPIEPRGWFSFISCIKGCSFFFCPPWVSHYRVERSLPPGSACIAVVGLLSSLPHPLQVTSLGAQKLLYYEMGSFNIYFWVPQDIHSSTILIIAPKGLLV